jgi:hypothetical protein
MEFMVFITLYSITTELQKKYLRLYTEGSMKCEGPKEIYTHFNRGYLNRNIIYGA